MRRGERLFDGRGKRGSYFFVLDAFIASAIFVLTIVTVMGLYVVEPESKQGFAYASDYLTFLHSTEIRDFHHSQVIEMRRDANFIDQRNTIAREVLILYNMSEDEPERLATAKKLINATMVGFPSDIAVNLSLVVGTSPDTREVVLYNVSAEDAAERETRLVLRSIEYAVINQRELFGPAVFLLEVWE